jgi:LacI family transcriptional regulator
VDAAGYGTYVCNTDGLHERERKFFQDVQDRGVDGIVLASGETASGIQFGPGDYGTPIVCVGEHLAHPTSDSVMADDERGSFNAASYLIDRGYQRIAMVQGPVRSADARTRGFRNAMQGARRKVPSTYLVRGDWTRVGGFEATQRLLNLPTPPDAVFCANDLMAMGALDAAHRTGLVVPDDLAVMGFDDVDAATVVAPPLTTVRNPAYETGSAAGDLLMSRMSGRYVDAGRTVVLPCPVIARDSA